MNNRQVPLMLSVPPECRDKLRKMAAMSNLHNPHRVTSASTIARELVIEGIERIERMEANLKSTDENAESISEFNVIKKIQSVQNTKDK